ncbi:Serine/threonine-protein kinase ht1 [Aphanomyces cochlioides]|nr:Serine/threonine-protein kinase ht1 [Aphanomyces cochlioides]
MEDELTASLLNKMGHSSLLPRPSAHLRVSAYVIAFSSFLWGYGFTVLNVCLPKDEQGSILRDFNMTEGEIELASSLVLIGAWFSAVTTASLGDKYGRRAVLIANNVLFIVGGLVCALTPTKDGIYVGRTIIGFACGIVTNVTPILLAEISPAQIRGQVTTLHQLLLTIGILGTSLLGYALVSNVPSGWRYVNAFVAVPAVLQCMLTPCIPESPRWLLSVNRVDDAKVQLRSLRQVIYETELDEEIQDIQQDLSSNRDHNPKDVTVVSLWRYKKAMILGSFLVFFQAMTGINTVMLYSTKIFEIAGVKSPIMATASVGTVNVLATVFSVVLVDTCGRKILLLLSSGLMSISLAVLSYALLTLSGEVQGILAVVCVLIFVIGFAIGLGAVIWVVLGELTPSSIRSRAMGVFMAISYACNVFVATCTLGIIQALGTGSDPDEKDKNGIAKLYLICWYANISSLFPILISSHSALSVACFIFIAQWLPETKMLHVAQVVEDSTPRARRDESKDSGAEDLTLLDEE